MATFKAPWTPEQVSNLNKWQHCGFTHSYTCGGNGDTCRAVLEATPDGWICAYCDYTQDFCLEAQANNEPPSISPEKDLLNKLNNDKIEKAPQEKLMSREEYLGKDSIEEIIRYHTYE